MLYRIHAISSAYSYVSTRNPEILNNHVELSSSDFGLAPKYLPRLANQFSQRHNIDFSAQLVNHSGYFQFTGDQAFPVLFLRANDQNGIDVLNAVDHIAEFKHAFVTPNILMIALISPYELHHNTNHSTDQVTGQPTDQVTGQPTDQVTGQPTDQVTGQPTDQVTGQPTDQVTGQPTDQITGQPTDQITGQPTDQITGQPTDQVTGQTTNQNTGQSTVQTPVPSQTAGGTQSTAGDHLNWPPGWVKHPQNHQNQQHGHNN
ncbi:PT domain-containing protein [Pseudoalteromonas sp. YIC-656]